MTRLFGVWPHPTRKRFAAAFFAAEAVHHIGGVVVLETGEEVAQARKIIAAFDLPENARKGVVQIDGRMVERLHAEMARRTVAIAEAISPPAA